MMETKTGHRTAAIGLFAALATTQAAAQYDPDAPEPIAPLRGSMVLAAGARSEEASASFRRLAGEDASLVVVSTERVDLAPYQTLGFANVALLATDSRTTSAREPFAAPLADAEGAWLHGDPARFAEVFAGTPVERALADLLVRGGVIGCSGDTARAVTEVMIAGGDLHPEVSSGLDLLPGAVVDTRAPSNKRLLGVLGARPHLVGLRIPTGSALVLRRRSLTALGEIEAIVAATVWRPLRIDRIGGRTRADLLALSRSAVARTQPRFPTASPPLPNVKAGALVIVGGGGMPPGLIDRFIELAGGPDAPLVYVPCSPAEKIEEEPRMVQTLRNAGAKDVSWIHTKDRHRCNHDEQILGPLRRARGIWFGGGRQWNFVDSYHNTVAHELMLNIVRRGGVAGGSSAGASIQAAYMARGHPVGNRKIMAEGYEQGLGFMTGVAIDQHFTQRRRQADMTALVTTYPQLLGIGLDETSAIVVLGSVAEVIARPGRRVHIYDRQQPVVPGRPDYLSLSHGMRYDLTARRVLGEGGELLPATTDVAGTWDLAGQESGLRLSINLDLTGSFQSGGRQYPVDRVVLDGTRIVAASAQNGEDEVRFEARLVDGSLQGEFSTGKTIASIVATRVAEPPPEDTRRGRRRRNRRR